MVLHVETGDYYGLNRIGTLIWKLIDGMRTEEAVVDELARRVDATPGRLETDVARFVARLRERNLVQ